MAADIVNTILDAIVETYPGEFNRGLDPADPLYLRSIVKAPLQDDPTLRAFYLEVGPDQAMTDDDNHWRMPMTSLRRGKLGVHQEHPMPEIGGGYKMINFFVVKGWLPMAGSREIAHGQAGTAVRRLERAFGRLAHGQFFNGLVTDDGMESTNAGFPQVHNMDGAHYALRGGDTEWYPQVSMRFHVFSEIARDYWGG